MVLLVLGDCHFYSLGSHYPLRRLARGGVEFPIHERSKTNVKNGDREREPRAFRHSPGHIEGNMVRRGVSEVHMSVQIVIDRENNLPEWQISGQ